jgi:hypothetical protein
MSLSIQKYLRVLVPGLLLYGLLVIFCWTTQWCNLAIPQTWEEATKLLAAILLGVAYHFTGLRELSNRFYHFDINSNIVRTLTQPFAKQMPNVRQITWPQLPATFYKFVDHDETLKVKSKIIRFNGLLWTSIADLRVVSIVAILLLSASMVCSAHITIFKFAEYRAGLPILLLTVVFLCTFWLSKIATERQSIGPGTV